MSHAIVRLADLLAARRRRSPATVCRWATGDGALYGRLRDGRDVTSRRAGRILSWFSSHWPGDLPWPADIPRPDPHSAHASCDARASRPGAS